MKTKTRLKRKSVDSGFEDWIRSSKIWEKRNELSKKDPSNLDFREHQILAQKIFEDGYPIEAFTVLHGLIEIHLNRLWQLFMATSGMFDEARTIPKPRSYSDLTDILYEAGLMEQETHQNLTDFNAHRNLLSHNLFGNKKKQTAKQVTEKMFEKGLLASGILPILLIKFLYHETKKNPKLKKVLKSKLRITI
ncbi:MAG: hypothetical protein KGI27_06045 [Thaumarchaeota archaeon]|nr:hypothetical protein [Nitrososphaerota archaeon]